MALVITVRDIAADLQTVLRLLQVICLLKVSVNCYTDNTIFFRKCCHDPWPLLRSVRPKSVLAMVSVIRYDTIRDAILTCARKPT